MQCARACAPKNKNENVGTYLPVSLLVALVQFFLVMFLDEAKIVGRKLSTTTTTSACGIRGCCVFIIVIWATSTSGKDLPFDPPRHAARRATDELVLVFFIQIKSTGDGAQGCRRHAHICHRLWVLAFLW